MNAAIGIAGIAMPAVQSNAGVDGQEPPSDREIVNLDHDYARSAWVMTCLGYDNAGATAHCGRLFGKRMKAVDRRAAANIGVAALAAARDREFGKDFLMLGGCRSEPRTGRYYGPTPDFDTGLSAIERRIPSRLGA